MRGSKPSPRMCRMSRREGLPLSRFRRDLEDLALRVSSRAVDQLRIDASRRQGIEVGDDSGGVALQGQVRVAVGQKVHQDQFPGLERGEFPVGVLKQHRADRDAFVLGAAERLQRKAGDGAGDERDAAPDGRERESRFLRDRDAGGDDAARERASRRVASVSGRAASTDRFSLLRRNRAMPGMVRRARNEGGD